MDSTSPSHAGFKTWRGALETSGRDLLNHYRHENSITEIQILQNIDAINQYMNK